MDKPITYVIVATYNEADNINELIPQLLELPNNLGVIVVDDGSPDGTGVFADQWATNYPDRVHVIHRLRKLGLGTAIIAGFKYALNRVDAQYIMTMDADFSHHPRYIPAMVALSDTQHVVIGSRYVSGGGVRNWPKPRVWLSSTSNFVARTLLGLKATDATAGFRLYHREVLESIDLDAVLSSGYSFMVEMLYLCQKQGWQVGEIPILFEDRRHGTTKISKLEIYKGIFTVFRTFYFRIIRKYPQKPQRYIL